MCLCAPTSSATLLGCDALCRHRWVLLEPVKRATGFNTEPHNDRRDPLFIRLHRCDKIEGSDFQPQRKPDADCQLGVFEFPLRLLALVNEKMKKTFLHVIRLLCIPLSSPLAGGVPVTCQSLLVDLLALLLPAEVLRPLPASHGHGHVHRAFWTRPSTLQEQERQMADGEK